MAEIEILAPAGSWEAMEAAVHCGADAVYMGAKALNARRGAANFTDQSFADAVGFCHARGAKVHMTLNTLLFDEELAQLKAAVRLACEAGVDAVIVQDLAVAALLRRWAPGLPLHASTQLSIHSLEGARAARALGFSRVVLARELTCSEIGRIVRAAGLECEVFVHGALCMCVSGQCTMSAMLGGRSGNRGLCAQPCRLPCRVTKGGNDHALSLKDLSLIERIEELAALGVASLKIEGRMKRPEYVAAAVTACREARAGRTVDLANLRAVFSRSGFTSGYFDNRIDGRMFGIRQKEDVTAAAGVLRELGQLAAREQPRVALRLSFALRAGQPARLTARDDEGRTVTVEGPVPQPALKRPTDQELAGTSLSKVGGTFYTLSNIDFVIDNGLMLPVAAINALRRDALERLTALRSRPRPRPFVEQPVAPAPVKAQPGQPALRVRLQAAEQLTDALLRQAEWISLPVAALLRGQPNPRLVVELPRVAFDTPRLRRELTCLREQGYHTALVHTLDMAQLAGELGFTLSGGFGLNLTNSIATAEAAAQLGLAELTLSFELSLARLRRVGSPVPVGALGYGRLPLMLLRNCPAKSAGGCRSCRPGKTAVLTDRTGARFPLLCDGDCAQLLNSVPLWLADRQQEFERLDFLTLYFTTETAPEVQRVWDAYREGAAATGPITRGLYYRTVL